MSVGNWISMQWFQSSQQVDMANKRDLRQVIIIILLPLLFFATILLFRNSSVCSEYNYGNTLNTQMSFDIRYVEENFNNLDQDDPHLIQYTRTKFLTPPSLKPYNLKTNGTDKMITSIADFVMKFFGDKRDGIFIEAGANDGESGSNTLYFETMLGWRGVLIECNPVLVPDIITKHRKAWVGNVCLAPGSTAGQFNFRFPIGYDVGGTLGKPLNEADAKRPAKFLDVQAVPLYTILAALGWKEIDFFSFDVEGIEWDLLKNFPFDKIIFKVIVMEIQYYSQKEREEIKEFLAQRDYIYVKQLVIDHIYVHKSVQHMIPK